MIAFKQIHPFPARMVPSIVLERIESGSKPIRILDPMAGSGTTVVSSKLSGHNAIGCDTDPLARLISTAWVSPFSGSDLLKRANLVVERARALLSVVKSVDSYPRGSDCETRKFIDFWFDEQTRTKLACLFDAISRVRSDIERCLLQCALSRRIVVKENGLSLAMDVSHSRPHRVYKVAPREVFKAFLESVEYLIKAHPLSNRDKSALPISRIVNADARNLPFRSCSFDLIITSPPYLNAIDYLRGHRLTLVWLGYNLSTLRSIRANNVGTENSIGVHEMNLLSSIAKGLIGSSRLPNRIIRMVEKYSADMLQVLMECKRVLKEESKLVIVIGNSELKSVYIENSELVKRLAELARFQVIDESKRPLQQNRRYLPPPEKLSRNGSLGRRMKEEAIITFVS